jgi:hypothetical protein
MSQRLTIKLEEHERQDLEQLTRKGESAARIQRRARILLLSDCYQGHRRIEPLTGFRRVWVRERRIHLDCAYVLRDLVDRVYLTALCGTPCLTLRVKKYEPQTPAMALGLTDCIWAIRDLLLTPVFSTGGRR